MTSNGIAALSTVIHGSCCVYAAFANCATDMPVVTVKIAASANVTVHAVYATRRMNLSRRFSSSILAHAPAEPSCFTVSAIVIVLVVMPV